ncbi:uncharacterized protein LOC115776924 [Archocentrus centrarchus]|uniref:uncharacterized protein LOC115776924 n=1 Tax=Archocentrus centrarchus TaxID=63155 RepID=UPI0011EA3538|nr:uncharacterized protein LOC115776924 [Archocentrus centrarchus]
MHFEITEKFRVFTDIKMGLTRPHLPAEDSDLTPRVPSSAIESLSDYYAHLHVNPSSWCTQRNRSETQSEPAGFAPQHQDQPGPSGPPRTFVRMWLLLMIVLLDQNQAAPLPGELHSLQLLQNQMDQTAPSPPPDPPHILTSSSSSSSSSVSSESSQSSEGAQMLRERLNLENTAVEQVDSSQESVELLQPPSYTNSTTSTNLWFNELVLLGERVGEQDGDGERDTGDNSVESEHRPLLMTFHHLLTRPRHRETNHISEAATEGDGGVGGAREETFELPRLSDDSTEAEHGLTFDEPDQGFHGDEAGLGL